VIIYRVESEDVVILHIIPAARDIEPLLSREGRRERDRCPSMSSLQTSRDGATTAARSFRYLQTVGCGYCKTTQIPHFCGMPLRPAIT
jgi:hypothetical protein